jgi:diguanylate cyclase (GGDEF)-like protein
MIPVLHRRGGSGRTVSTTEAVVDARRTGARDDAGDERAVDSRAFAHVVENLAPLPFLLVPFTVFVSWLMRSDLPTYRSGVWIATSIVAAVVAVVARLVARRDGLERADGFLNVVVVGVALALSSSVFGMSTWVASDATFDVVALFMLFPAIACAIGASVCAGRRWIYGAFLLPSVLWTPLGLWASGDSRLRGMTYIAAFYLMCMIVIHQVATRSFREVLRLQGRDKRLLAQIEQEQQSLRDVNERLSESNEMLGRLASNDQLTGLLNRRGTFETIDRLLGDASRPVGLLFCDLDRFKSVNDALGHHGGDQFLKVLADRITRTIGAECVAGRIGGDEFVIALPDHDVHRSATAASRLLAVLAQPVHAEGRDLPSSASIGIAEFPAHGSTANDLLRNANTALYRAKNAGRSRIEVFDAEMKSRREELLEAEHSLRRAIENGEILPFFQPEIDAATGRLVGAEILARWLRSDGSVTNAAEFIAVAKSAGLLERLTERMIVQARPQIRRLASLGLPEGFRFRVNLPPSSTTLSWRDDPLDALVRGIDASLLTVDVHESAVADDLPTAAATLAAFRARGGRVCLDDFARGVSSLSLLRRLPIDEVRIDRHEIDAITAHPHDRAIVRSIIAVVREIGLAVTADGVETGAQADALIALGCVRCAAAVPCAAWTAMRRWSRSARSRLRSARRTGGRDDRRPTPTRQDASSRSRSHWRRSPSPRSPSSLPSQATTTRPQPR